MPKRKTVAVEDDESVESGEEPRPLKQSRSVKTTTKTKTAKKPVQESSEEEAESSKRQKKVANKPISKDVTESEDVNEGLSISVKVNDEGDKYIELGKKRRATVRAFKGTSFLDIREYYGADGEEKPGKKGVTLNQEQWEILKTNSDVIDALFKKLKK